MTESRTSGLSRRTIVTGVAWTVPVLTLAVAAPASAASVVDSIDDHLAVFLFNVDGTTASPGVQSTASPIAFQAALAQNGDTALPPGTVLTVAPRTVAGTSWSSLTLLGVEDDTSDPVPLTEGTDYTVTSSGSSVAVVFSNSILVNGFIVMSFSAVPAAVTPAAATYATAFTGTVTSPAYPSQTGVGVSATFTIGNPVVADAVVVSVSGPQQAPAGIDGGVPYYGSSATYSFASEFRNDGPFPVPAGSIVKLIPSDPSVVPFSHGTPLQVYSGTVDTPVAYTVTSNSGASLSLSITNPVASGDSFSVQYSADVSSSSSDLTTSSATWAGVGETAGAQTTNNTSSSSPFTIRATL